MIDHIGIAATDLAASRAFFLQALAPLGTGVIMAFDEAVGLGRDRT